MTLIEESQHKSGGTHLFHSPKDSFLNILKVLVDYFLGITYNKKKVSEVMKMENNNYFAEMMKSPMPREQVKNATAAYIDNLLNDILFKQEKHKLMKAIDQSLDEGNRQLFIELSAQLNELEEKFKNI